MPSPEAASTDFPPLDFVRRRRNAQAGLVAGGIEALVAPISADLQFLTGLALKKGDRPIFLVLPRDGDPALVCPRFERERLAAQFEPLAIQTYTEGEDSFTRLQAILPAQGKVALAEKAWFSEAESLAAALPSATLVSAAPVLGPLRWRKGEPELARLRHAALTWQRVLADVLIGVEPGVRGAQIKEQIVVQLTAAGGSAPSCTVNIGAASALPHGGRSDEPLTKGDVLLIDGGIAWDGYRSDITRTYAFGSPSDEVLTLLETVLAAEAAGIAAVKPGAAAESIDAAARRVISDAGYGAAFTHRVGHGLGLEGKEPPYLAAGNPQLLEPGMVITIEPGIYLPGKFGVRIEDDIVVSESGSEPLSAGVHSVDELFL